MCDKEFRRSIKPCPFCGAKPVGIDMTIEEDKNGVPHVIALSYKCDFCQADITTNIIDNNKDALDVWNQRVKQNELPHDDLLYLVRNGGKTE